MIQSLTSPINAGQIGILDHFRHFRHLMLLSIVNHKMNLNIKHVDRACLVIVVMVSLVCGYLAVNQIMKKKQQFGIEKDILSKRMKEVNLASTNLEESKGALG